MFVKHKCPKASVVLNARFGTVVGRWDAGFGGMRFHSFPGVKYLVPNTKLGDNFAYGCGLCCNYVTSDKFQRDSNMAWFCCERPASQNSTMWPQHRLHQFALKHHFSVDIINSIPSHIAPTSVNDGCPIVAEWVEVLHSVCSSASGRSQSKRVEMDEYLYSKDLSGDVSRPDSRFTKIRFVIAEKLRMHWRLITSILPCVNSTGFDQVRWGDG